MGYSLDVGYDFHIHSCLSPCAENEMTVNNIANMAVICGLDAIALTDHNSLKNCPAFFLACERAGVLPVAGVEVCTREEVHALCYFPTLDDAMAFDRYLDALLPPIKNRPDVFGDQVILDAQDNQIGVEERLLVAAADLSLDDLPREAARRGGIVVPAHIDRTAFSMIANLGFVYDDAPFTCYEVRDHSLLPELSKKNPGIAGAQILKSSDAHTLVAIQEREPVIGVTVAGDILRAADIIAALSRAKSLPN